LREEKNLEQKSLRIFGCREGGVRKGDNGPISSVNGFYTKKKTGVESSPSLQERLRIDWAGKGGTMAIKRGIEAVWNHRWDAAGRGQERQKSLLGTLSRGDKEEHTLKKERTGKTET